jgi:hypothetical protein
MIYGLYLKKVFILPIVKNTDYKVLFLLCKICLLFAKIKTSVFSKAYVMKNEIMFFCLSVKKN